MGTCMYESSNILTYILVCFIFLHLFALSYCVYRGDCGVYMVGSVEYLTGKLWLDFSQKDIYFFIRKYVQEILFGQFFV